MKRILTGVLVIALTITFSVIALASNGEKTAAPSQTKFIMDGKEVTFDVAYNIEDSNYIQLRSVAQTLNGTTSQFNVYWDNDLQQAVIETGKPYTGVKPESVIDLTNNPTAAQVSGTVANVSGITDIEIVTEDHDPNGQLGKQGGYTGCLYFRYSLVDQSQLYVAEGTDVNSSIDIGTRAGGCIEIYATAKDAERRNTYLAGFDGGALSSGSHTVLGTLLIRTSSELKASQQKTLENAIISALTGGTINAPAQTPTVTPSPSTPVENSYKIGDKVTVANTEITITKLFATKNAGSFVANGGEEFYGITFDILTQNQPDSGRAWYGNSFISHILTIDGVKYEQPSVFDPSEKDKIYANVKNSVTVYISIEQGENIASIIVSDGKGNYVTISTK
jgi:hypothetical protein